MEKKKQTEEEVNQKPVKEKKGKKLAEVVPFVPPQNLDLRIPAGAEDFVTFRICGEKLLQASPRGFAESELQKKIDEAKRREMTEEEQVKLQKIKTKVVFLPEEIAEQLTYPTEDGRYYHPAPAFLGAMVDAFKVTEAVFPGERFLAYKKINSNVHICHEQCILFDPQTNKPFRQPKNGEKAPYLIDFRTGLNRIAGKRIALWRPLFLKWGVFVTFSYNTGLITPSVIKQGLKIAGNQVGIGAFRPLPPQNMPPAQRGRGGPFGRFFEVEVWDKKIPTDLEPLI